LKPKKNILIAGANAFIGCFLIYKHQSKFDVFVIVPTPTKVVRLISTHLHVIIAVFAGIVDIIQRSSMYFNAGVITTPIKEEFFRVNFVNAKHNINTLKKCNKILSFFLFTRSNLILGKK